MFLTTSKATSSLEDVEQNIEVNQSRTHRLSVIALVLFIAWIGCSMLSFQDTKKPEAGTSGFYYINE